jgi:hypothetical protein
MEGVRGSIPLPPTTETQQNRHKHSIFAEDVPASSCLNKPRTVPKSPEDLGTKRARRSRKVPEEPTRQKRSPASPASENGAKRKPSHRKNTKSRADAQESASKIFWITHGTTNIGYVRQSAASYEALDNDERLLGIFGSLREAADAVDAAFDGSNGSAPVPLSTGSTSQVGDSISAGGVE